MNKIGNTVSGHSVQTVIIIITTCNETVFGFDPRNRASAFTFSDRIIK